jgi:uncharacterized membrane protein
MDVVLNEDLLPTLFEPLVVLAEAGSVLVITIGALVGFVRFVSVAIRTPHGEGFVAIRLELGRYLTLGLEFLLAADIMRTAIRPSFQEIGQLAAIAAIRTGLAFFLEQEMRQEQTEIARQARERGDDDD